MGKQMDGAVPKSLRRSFGQDIGVILVRVNESLICAKKDSIFAVLTYALLLVSLKNRVELSKYT